MSDTIVPIRRALLSVSDKSGLAEFARTLIDHGAELISTGGTARALRDAGLAITEVSEVTGFPEMMDGRVRTLHPAVHGGLLAVRSNPEHRAALAGCGIEPIDLVASNLYPFEESIAGGADPETAIENIDIGGPAMIRAAAKNHGDVTVVTDPADYAGLADEIARNGGTTLKTRRKLATRAFARTAAYDAAIAGWFAGEAAGETGDDHPRRLTVSGRLVDALRYGENPHQRAAFYASGRGGGLGDARQIQGKTLSYNNLNDADAALELAADLDPDRPAVAIIKHANPCGVATDETLAKAHARALACDSVSAFGGIVAVNRPLDEAAATAITTVFTEVVIAPGADAGARAVFAAKPSLRLLIVDAMPDPEADAPMVRSLRGGFLLQSRDNGRIAAADTRTVTRRAPTAQESRDLVFAFQVAKHVKSNAIVYAKDGATVGIGAGQMSRVDSARIAAKKAEDAARVLGLESPLTQGSVVASDAFFPFADGLEAAIAAGATAVVQPGGSKRDDEVIAAADAAGIAMVFTGMRHFRH